MTGICNSESSSLPATALPDSFQRQKREQKMESAVQSLVGMIPYTDLSLAELREERLKKYDRID